MWDLPSFGLKKGGTYIAKDCGHLKNMRLYAQRGPKSVFTQVNKPMGEGNQKMVQMKDLFHVFTHGHPMLEYEAMYELFARLGVPNNPTMHWFDYASWILVKNLCMSKFKMPLSKPYILSNS